MDGKEKTGWGYRLIIPILFALLILRKAENAYDRPECVKFRKYGKNDLISPLISSSQEKLLIQGINLNVCMQTLSGNWIDHLKQQKMWNICAPQRSHIIFFLFLSTFT